MTPEDESWQIPYLRANRGRYCRSTLQDILEWQILFYYFLVRFACTAPTLEKSKWRQYPAYDGGEVVTVKKKLQEK